MPGKQMVLSEGIEEYSLKKLNPDFPDAWWEKGEIVEVMKILISSGNMWLKATEGRKVLGSKRRFLIRKFPVEADIFEREVKLGF